MLRGAAARTDSLTARIYQAWRRDRFTLVVSDAILSEIEAVLRRPEVLRKLGLGLLEARALVALLRRRSHRVASTNPIHLSRDPADDKFLECAVAARADFLTSRRSGRGCARQRPAPYVQWFSVFRSQRSGTISAPL